MKERDDDPARGGPRGDTAQSGNAESSADAALASLREAAASKPELPPPPRGFDDPQLRTLNDVWRLLPRQPETEIDLGTGWRRRLRDAAWRLLRPILERQQRFNTALVQHLVGDREAAGRAVAALDRLAAIQFGIVDYLGHLSQTDRDIEHRAEQTTAQTHQALERTTAQTHQALERTTAQVHQALERTAGELSRSLKETAGELRESVGALERTTEDMRQSVELATASTHGLKREVKQLRGPSTARPAGADDGRGETGDADPGTAAPTPAGKAATDLDAYQYICFEDVFRGASEDIAKRQRAYLPYFEGASDVLDVGCGRGEFLALLRDDGIAARGVDTNAEAVERCRERGLDAARCDALGYLRTLADESLGGLFSAQVVEHLEADYLMRMLADAHRALRPGSRVVLETINPASWTAFFSAYVRDVTHRHPLHPDTLAYLLRASGFVGVSIVYRSPVPDAAKLRRAEVDPALAATPEGKAVSTLADALNQHAELLNGLIFAEQDYAAIGRRP